MKFSIAKSSFLKALQHIQGCVEKKHTVPILANVKIEATKNKLILTANSLDMEATDVAGCEVQSDGVITVQAATIIEIVKKLSDETINIELAKAAQEGNLAKLIIKSGNVKFELATMPADDFPIMAGTAFEATFKVSADSLLDVINKTKFAISNDETRYSLNGILLHFEESNGKNKLMSVATDGHRLAIAELELSAPEKFQPIIVPRKTINEIVKMLEGQKGDVSISISSNKKVLFKVGDYQLFSKLIDGEFPDYKKVIPLSNNKVLDIDREQLLRAVDRVSAINLDITKGIRFDVEKDKITLAANSQEQDSATEEVTATFSEDSGLTTAYNPRYMMEILSHIHDSKVRFSLLEANLPALIRSIGDTNSFYVLMPMRL